MLPDTRYARLRGERIAYQILGEGPRDLVLTTGSFSNGDLEWEDATLARLLMRLASFARVIRAVECCQRPGRPRRPGRLLPVVSEMRIMRPWHVLPTHCSSSTLSGGPQCARWMARFG
jgi:hypothetical protein